MIRNPKGPKYLYGTKYGFCSSTFPYGLGKYSPYGYLGPFGKEMDNLDEKMNALLREAWQVEPIIFLDPKPTLNWVAFKEVKLSYYIGETLLYILSLYIPIMVT